ncbi:MAG: family 20 glycosylhydrolase [Solirubrobacterales bacterium]
MPALRHWRPAGRLAPRAPLRVVARGPALREARLLAADLAAAIGSTVRAVSGPAPRRGDVTISVGVRTGLGREGYRLRIGRTFAIEASRAAGAFYGGQTLVELLQGGADPPRGVAVDRPRYPERGLMIDLGRRTYRMAWVRREIRQLAHLKMNLLHLHLSDDQRWGIRSRRHPGLASPGALTIAQVRSLVAFARRRHVTVVPEIDMPGHMGALLAQHPGLALRRPGEDPSAPSSRLDVTNPAAVRFAEGIVREYLPLFPGPYWHVGADEYLPDAALGDYPQLASYARARYGRGAVAKDAVLGFVNRIDRLVRAHGKTLRAWHDELGGGAAVTPRADIVVEWWTPISPLSDLTPPAPAELLAGGHRILNCGWFPTYFTGSAGPVEGKPDMRSAYEGWSVNQFAGPTVGGSEIAPRSLVPPRSRRNLGAKVNAWEDTDLGDAELREGLLPRLAVIAQKTWGSRPLTPSYDAFHRIVARLGEPPASR